MDLFQHYRKEEHTFIEQVISWKENVEQTYQSKLTDFLDPREQQIVKSIIGSSNDDLQFGFFGGGANSERKRAIIAPFYEEISEADYQLKLMQATYQNKFISLSHRDVMGAFLSLGIKRSKLGDIVVGDTLIQIMMAEEISPYVIANLTTIKNANIKLEGKSLADVIDVPINWVESDQTVSSLRLDNVLKEIYNMSRKEAAEAIVKKLVKVNYKVVEDVKFTLQADDLISLRGKGRSKLVRVNGLTKKDRIRITTAILK